MDNERLKIGDEVEITGLSEPNVDKIMGESSDTRGLLFFIRPGNHQLGAEKEKFLRILDKPGEIAQGARRAVKWTIDYGELEYMRRV